jgi:uncharacterized glyoxalase superfamily protein PhnB
MYLRYELNIIALRKDAAMPEPRLNAFVPALFYRDPFAALDFLERAFGFERTMVITDADGNLAHSQMSYREGTVMIGTEWEAHRRSPSSIGGKTTQTVHVHLDEDIDGHFERARAAGAVIEQGPEDQFYGDRTYRAFDLEGHIWTFSHPGRPVSREEAEASSGLKIEARDWA